LRISSDTNKGWPQFRHDLSDFVSESRKNIENEHEIRIFVLVFGNG
jgi:hypothetical protein